MQQLDLKKDLKYLYTPKPDRIEIVDVPALNFVMLDGAIEPDQTPSTSQLFTENVQALYGMAYTLKFSLKQRKENSLDYPIMALEGLWWVQDGHFDIRKPGNWKYTLMIMQPDQVTVKDFTAAVNKLRKKKGDQPAFDRLRVERIL